MFILLLLAIGLVVYLFWYHPGQSYMPVNRYSRDETDRAIDLLKRRYINGEIDEETYDKLKRTINE